MNIELSKAQLQMIFSALDCELRSQGLNAARRIANLTEDLQKQVQKHEEAQADENKSE